MENVEKKGPLNNQIKIDLILDKWYEENFQKKDPEKLENYKISKVNLTTNDVVANLDTPLVEDYVKGVFNKKTNIVSDKVITLDKNQDCLNIVFYCSTNYFDQSNPQKGICSGKNEEIISNLASVNPKGKTIVIFGGDLLGEEWPIKYLRTARIENNKALYFGLNKRKARLINDIKKFFSYSDKLDLDIDIYLMRGYQEHYIYKESGRDILGEVTEELSNKYLRNKTSRLHYLDDGVSLALNIVKKKKNATYNATIGLQTNMRNKSLTAKGEESASYNYNGTLPTTINFVCNGNFAGKLNDSSYHVSGQSQFLRTTKGKKPQLAPKGYNVFTIYPEGENELTVQEGGANIFPVGLPLQKEIYKAEKKKDYLLQACDTLFKKQLDSLNLMEEKE